MSARTGKHLTRTIQTSAKEHRCFANCGGPISKGLFYIKDVLLEVVGYRQQDKYTLMTLAWHLACAPETKAEAIKILQDAAAEHAKHPSRTGAEYADA